MFYTFQWKKELVKRFNLPVKTNHFKLSNKTKKNSIFNFFSTFYYFWMWQNLGSTKKGEKELPSQQTTIWFLRFDNYLLPVLIFFFSFSFLFFSFSFLLFSFLPFYVFLFVSYLLFLSFDLMSWQLSLWFSFQIRKSKVKCLQKSS